MEEKMKTKNWGEYKDMNRLFFGGIHPTDKKDLIERNQSMIELHPAQVKIPLRQHIGESCKPLVQIGELVRIGQKIGDGEGVCVPVHASVSGEVTSIEEIPHPDGESVQAIVIKNDFKETWIEKTEKQVNDLLVEELFALMKEAGIVGMGGAAFPTDVKIASSYKKIDTLLINACECEPYLTADEAQMCAEPEIVLKGIDFLSRCLEAKHTVLAIEDNKKKGIREIEKYISNYPGIHMQILPAKYPQGAEKQLIRAVTGREVLPENLPVSVGCIVFNVSTVASIYRAIFQGIPVVKRIVSVTGEGITSPQNMVVPIGTSFANVIEAAGGVTDTCAKIIAGGPMMGRGQSTLDVPVIKATGAVLCLAHTDESVGKKCIRCGKCVEVCPMYLQPLYLYRYGKLFDRKKLDQLNLMDCMECGCCSYICPGKLPLVGTFRERKRMLREEK
jgi:electron transport complex protein RnfC